MIWAVDLYLGVRRPQSSPSLSPPSPEQGLNPLSLKCSVLQSYSVSAFFNRAVAEIGGRREKGHAPVWDPQDALLRELDLRPRELRHGSRFKSAVELVIVRRPHFGRLLQDQGAANITYSMFFCCGRKGRPRGRRHRLGKKSTSLT